MVTLGIDIALRNQGVCVLNDNKVVYHERFNPTAGDFYHPEFLVEHEKFLNICLATFNPDIVALEGGSLASKNWQMSIGELFGLYSLTLYKSQIPTVILPPMKWKKIFTGRGDATKARIREVATHNFTYSPKKGRRVSQDEYDATGIAFVGYLSARLYKGETLKLQKEILKLFKGESGILEDKYLNYNMSNLLKK